MKIILKKPSFLIFLSFLLFQVNAFGNEDCRSTLAATAKIIKENFVEKILLSDKTKEQLNGFTPAIFSDVENENLISLRNNVEDKCADLAGNDEISKAYDDVLSTLLAFENYFRNSKGLYDYLLKKTNTQAYSDLSFESLASEYKNSVVFLDTGVDLSKVNLDQINNIIPPLRGLALDGEDNFEKYWSHNNHGLKVIYKYHNKLKEHLSDNPSLTVNNKLIPVNFLSFYDFFENLYFGERQPYYMHFTATTLTKLFDSKIRIVNFSGSVDRPSDEFYQLFEKYPEVIWVVAAGNQGIDLDKKESQEKYPISPQLYINKTGDRFDNIINVTSSTYDEDKDKHFIGYNYGSKFVDISVDSYYQTSFAAPLVTACIVAILEKSDRYLSPKEVKNLLIKSSTQNAFPSNEPSQQAIPVLNCQNALNSLEEI